MAQKNSTINNVSKIDIGNRIKSLRQDANMTIKAISEQTGLSVGSISEIERGISYPSLPALVLFAKLFDVSLDYLVFGYIDSSLSQPITDIEFQLLDFFRKMKKDDKDEIFMLSRHKIKKKTET